MLSALIFNFAAIPLVTGAAEFRELPQLEATPETVHPIPLGFTSRSVLPSLRADEAPSLLISNHGEYLAKRNVIYRPVAQDGWGKYWSLPEDFPLYDEGIQYDEIKGSRYIAVYREDCLYDLVRPSDWMYLKQVGTPDKPHFQESYKIQLEGKPPQGKEWVADLDGDGIPDLLVGAPDPGTSQFQMYPNYEEYGHPWSGIENPNLGMLPDSDIQNFRGYDIAGNWLGNPVTRYLWWAKGRMDNGQLIFGEPTKVCYGSTDYPLQWRGYGFNLHPVVMELEGLPHIILFTDNDKAMIVPVREVVDGKLHVGKAQPLLKGGARLKSTIHANVIGVADMNLDGQQDLIIGSGANGRLTVLSGSKAGEFTELGNIFHEGGEVSADTLVVPVRADWNKDGCPDLIIGDASGMLSLRYGTDDPYVYDDYLNFKTPSGYIRHRPLDGNLQGDNETAWSYTQPEVFDWDRDGNLDIITNDNEAKLFFYKGTGASNLLEERERLMMGDKPLPVAWRTRPAVIDRKYGVAGDDRDVLLMIQWDNNFAMAIPDAPGSLNFERLIEVKDVTGETINISGPGGFTGRIKLSVCDWDNDGKWDVVFGSQKSLQKYFRLSGNESPSAAAFWMRNVGTNMEPVFELPQMITFSDGSPIVINKHNFNVYPTDLDGDGELDIIFGDDEGFLFYLNRDDLAWAEDTEPEKQLRAALKSAKNNTGNYKSGDTIAAEDWTAPSSNDMYWASEWMTTQEGLLSVKDGMARLNSRPPRLSEMKRYLARPIEFDPQAPITLRYRTRFIRQDSRNVGGNEFIELLNLKSSDGGQSLVAVGFSSAEELEIKSRGEKVTIAGSRLKLKQSYVIDVEINLQPEGKDDSISVVVSEDNGSAHIQLAKGKMTIPISGIADVLELEVGKNAGFLGIGSLVLQVQ
ncbi:VCBS repeat-containing protein [Ruficoccus amylovorans]|uniref:VCBS repeat-containing protein n=1 Tax=Ruficoccus amylovorans TaxID=1804625 RepID=A0A842HCH0_9BACT|nr:FG-GAP-like repeat-containing protein [Ruficoccus amylovorans]MBC2593889.1 VCBS repeat-containing protein [Ruficoccus amylovorans]